MKRIVFLLGAVLSAAGIARAEGPAAAKAVLVNSAGEEVGSARLEEVPGGVKVTLEVSKLSPGAHALHIHEAGTCEPPDFKSAGGHFNPAGKKHGVDNPEGHHAGDLPNIEVGPDGTSLVIHAGPDDNRTDPAGNAGVRIACGVIHLL